MKIIINLFFWIQKIETLFRCTQYRGYSEIDENFEPNKKTKIAIHFDFLDFNASIAFQTVEYIRQYSAKIVFIGQIFVTENMREKHWF
jgi:hypothetical protein